MTRFDFELEPLIPTLPPLDASDPIKARERSKALGEGSRPDYSALEARVDWSERTIPGPVDAPDLLVRIYTPKEQARPLPCLAFFHGGGWISGDLENGHWRCLQIANEVGCMVVTPDYRLAPENPFPAAPEDCYATWLWTYEQAAGLDVDTSRLGVGGVSAGAGLAAGVTLMARDRQGPPIAFQWLLYPGLDDRMETVSNKEYTDAPVWGSAASQWAWRFYLGEGKFGPDVDDVSPYGAPARATDLSNLPPAYLMTSDIDPTRDEGIDYGYRLLQAGVSVDLHNWANTFHAFDFVGQATEIGRRAVDEGLFWLRRAVR